MPVSRVSSGIFGVTTSASGSSRSTSVSMASAARSGAPLVATITGSTTTCAAWYSWSFAAIVSMSAHDDVMPILTARGGMSVNTASSSAARNSGATSAVARTPCVFCAVSAVMALMP